MSISFAHTSKLAIPMVFFCLLSCSENAVNTAPCTGNTLGCVDTPIAPIIGATSVWLASGLVDNTLTVAVYDKAIRALYSWNWTGQVLEPTHRISANGPDVDRGQYVRMMSGPNDSLYVAYYDAKDTDIRRAKLTNGNWLEMDGVVDGDTADVGTWLSLAIGQDGGWHIAYRDDTTSSLRIVSLEAGNNGCYGENGPGTPLRITHQDMADAGFPSADFGTHTSTGVLSDGRVAVSFYDAWRTNLMLVTCKADSFQLQLLDGEAEAEASIPDTDAGRWSSLAVDPSTGRLGVAYHDATLGALKYITSRDGTQTPIIVDDGGNAGHHVGLSATLAFEARPGFSESLPRIAYIDSTGRKIQFARQSVYGEWARQTVTTLPPLGEQLGGFGPILGLTIDTQERAYITYSQWTDEKTELYVAVCDGPLCAEGPE